jgi:filamentous hemagglutinin
MGMSRGAANLVDAGISIFGSLGVGWATAAAENGSSISRQIGNFLADESGTLKLGGNAPNAIRATGQVGENALKSLGGESQVYFKTSLGGRYVDQLAGGIANESKVGYTCLTSDIQLQVAKDAELIAAGRVQGATWHFFTSPVTGVGGPSQPLLNALQQAGINVVIH